MLSTSFGALMFSFGVALVCVMALAKRRDIVAIRFLFFSIACCGWGFLYAIWTIGNLSEQTTLFLTRTSHYFAVFIPLTWLHFVFTFINKEEPFKGFYFLNYVFSSFLFASNSTSLFISGVGPIMQFSYFTEPGPIYYSFTAYFFI